MKKPETLCSFHLCVDKAIEPPTKGEMQFCITHDCTSNQAFKSEDPMQMLGFWIKAQGGSKRAAALMACDLTHRDLLEGEAAYWQ